MTKITFQWLVLALYFSFIPKGNGTEIKSLQEESKMDSAESTMIENESEVIFNSKSLNNPYEFLNKDRYKRKAGAEKIKEKFDNTRDQAKSGAEIAKSKAKNPEEMKGMADAAKQKAAENVPMGTASSGMGKIEEMKEAGKGAMASNPIGQGRKKRTPDIDTITENSGMIEGSSPSADSAMQVARQVIAAGEEMKEKIKEIYKEAKKKIEEITKT